MSLLTGRTLAPEDRLIPDLLIHCPRHRIGGEMRQVVFGRCAGDARLRRESVFWLDATRRSMSKPFARSVRPTFVHLRATSPISLAKFVGHASCWAFAEGA